MVMHPTSSPSMTRRRPASASAKMVTTHILDEKHEETTDGPKSTSKTSTYLVIVIMEVQPCAIENLHEYTI